MSSHVECRARPRSASASSRAVQATRSALPTAGARHRLPDAIDVRHHRQLATVAVERQPVVARREADRLDTTHGREAVEDARCSVAQETRAMRLALLALQRARDRNGQLECLHRLRRRGIPARPAAAGNVRIINPEPMSSTSAVRDLRPRPAPPAPGDPHHHRSRRAPPRSVSACCTRPQCQLQKRHADGHRDGETCDGGRHQQHVTSMLHRHDLRAARRRPSDDEQGQADVGHGQAGGAAEPTEQHRSPRAPRARWRARRRPARTRMTSSGRCACVRTSTRFATFAHAISQQQARWCPSAATASRPGRRPRCPSGTELRPEPRVLARSSRPNSCRSRIGIMRATSALASASVTPSFRRAMARPSNDGNCASARTGCSG